MLRESAVAMASVLAEKFAQRGLELAVLPNTPLASLLGATDRTAIAVVDVSHPQIREVLEQAVRSTNFTPDAAHGWTPHDEIQMAATMKAKQAVLRHVQAIRLFVIPAIKELYEAAQLGMQDLSISSILNFEIKPYDLPLPLRNASFHGLIDPYGKNGYDEKKLLGERLNAGNVADEGLRAFLKTGLGSLDKELDIWAASISNDWLSYVWKKFFQSNNHVTPPASNDVQELKLTEALLVFLIARQLVDKEPIEGSSMKLSDYTLRAKYLRAQSAAFLQQTLDRWKKLSQRQVVVLRTDANTVVVNEPVYRKWLADNAQSAIDPNEVLFGSLIDNARLTTVKELDADALKLQQLWLRYVGRTSITERKSRLILLKKVLERVFRQSIAELVADEECQRVGQYDREQVLKRFRIELDQLKEKDLDDLHSVVKRLVCRARFHHIDAESFIDDISLIERDHPKLPIREITAIATMNYVSRWVCSMMMVKAV